MEEDEENIENIRKHRRRLFSPICFLLLFSHSGDLSIRMRTDTNTLKLFCFGIAQCVHCTANNQHTETPILRRLHVNSCRCIRDHMHQKTYNHHSNVCVRVCFE